MPSAPRDWWRTWFDASYLRLYDPWLQERTPAEVDRLESLLALEAPLRILDLGCGQGRHAIELARRGYDVIGLDASPYLLAVAAERARAAGVAVEWQQGDMRQLAATGEFDLVVNLFTSFGYFHDDADNTAVLQAAASSLRPGGRLVLELLNGERVVRTFSEREWFTIGSMSVLDIQSLDRAANRLEVERTVEADGHRETRRHSLRLYEGREIATLLEAAGFARVALYGGWDGEPFSPLSRRLLAVAAR